MQLDRKDLNHFSLVEIFLLMKMLYKTENIKYLLQ